MDIGAIVQAALPLAMSAAGLVKVAEAVPGVPVEVKDQGSVKHLSILGAVVVILVAAQKIQEGNAASIDPTEIILAVGVVYASAMGMLGALSHYFVKKG